MAFNWQNSFEGPAGFFVTEANSANSGDALDNVVGGVRYTDSWSHVGRTSLRLDDSDSASNIAYVVINGYTPTRAGGGRMYLRVLSGRCVVDVRPANGDNLTWHVYADGSIITPGQSRTSAGQFDASLCRFAWTTASSNNRTYIYDGSEIDGDTYTYYQSNSAPTPDGGLSLWLFAADGVTEVDSLALDSGAIQIGAADQFFEGSASASVDISGTAYGSVWDPAILSAHVHLTGSVSGSKHANLSNVTGPVILTGSVVGEAGDPTPLPPIEDGATLARDLWIGPLGDLRRVQRGAETDHEYELGNSQFTSLSGRVTSSRARYAPMTRSYSWERLDVEERDWLNEVAFLSRTAATTVEAVSPHADNLLTAEQSRGAPRAGVVGDDAVSALYSVAGEGSLAVTTEGRRQVRLTNAVEGSRVTWLHPYHGSRGWPCMPGWPVYFYLNGTLAGEAGAELVFFSENGSMLGRAYMGPGSDPASARAPEGTATVSPRAVVTAVTPPSLTLGDAWLLYRPIPYGSRVPLGDGCPTVAVTAFGEAPFQRWTDVELELTEVTSSATR